MSNEEQPETGHHLSIDEDPPPAYASQDSQENSGIILVVKQTVRQKDR